MDIYKTQQTEQLRHLVLVFSSFSRSHKASFLFRVASVATSRWLPLSCPSPWPSTSNSASKPSCCSPFLGGVNSVTAACLPNTSGLCARVEKENRGPTCTMTLGYHQIELVPPTLRFTPIYPFRDHIRGVWDCIEPPCAVWTNDSWGTHVHLSPGTGHQ
ncbi:hypothetical protein BDM02DRAFT_1773646 [Thelephora ganbajun]|uniref:Uncharacterized protein n=1 Tax=Thelephora ganbajun TaxID=370292 RepID=A0ACB6Z0H3_THEGA|nr:hypothetical protein BDM02DRAFT_1773646 [Thelephora ganbajun]